MSNPELAEILKAEKRASGRWRLYVIAAVAVLVILGVAGWKLSSRGGKETTYVTEPLVLGTIRLTVNATGNLEPTNEVTVGSELSGTIKEVLVDTNDQVVKGQPLARLDTSKLDQQTESSRAMAARFTMPVICVSGCLPARTISSRLYSF